ncbi:MAG TPA: hypothetical protein VED59_08695 [Acidimicrobiales bacterium]|nr:hypothetical protein [Acidimicrobiales bacterium]
MRWLASDLNLLFDAFSVVGAELSLRRVQPPRRAVAQLGGQVLDHSFDGQYCSLKADVFDGHRLVVFEH